MNELEQFLSKCEATYTGSVSSVGEYLKGQTMAYEALPLLVKMLRAIIARADRDNLLYGG